MARSRRFVADCINVVLGMGGALVAIIMFGVVFMLLHVLVAWLPLDPKGFIGGVVMYLIPGAIATRFSWVAVSNFLIPYFDRLARWREQ